VIDQGVQARSDIAGNDPGILVELLVMADAYLYLLLQSRAIDLYSDQLEPVGTFTAACNAAALSPAASESRGQPDPVVVLGQFAPLPQPSRFASLFELSLQPSNAAAITHPATTHLVRARFDRARPAIRETVSTASHTAGGGVFRGGQASSNEPATAVQVAAATSSSPASVRCRPSALRREASPVVVPSG